MAPSDLPDVIMENGLQPDVTSSDKHALRRIALAEVDNAPLGLSHLRAVVVAGTGFFTDAYDLFSANFITTMIGLAFYKSHVIPTSVDTAIKLSTTAGAVLGQVVFGWLADKLGRKRMYGRGSRRGGVVRRPVVVRNLLRSVFTTMAMRSCVTHRHMTAKSDVE